MAWLTSARLSEFNSAQALLSGSPNGGLQIAGHQIQKRDTRELGGDDGGRELFPVQPPRQ